MYEKLLGPLTKLIPQIIEDIKNRERKEPLPMLSKKRIRVVLKELG